MSTEKFLNMDGLRKVANRINAVESKSANMVETTWSALKALRDGGKLSPGTQYRITDYQCTTSQADTSSAGHVFDVIVTADSEDTLNENARACLHEGDTYFASNKLEAWQLWYSIDNDTDRFGWADATNGKGVIYRMIDEFDNDVPYDFKNILFEKKPMLTAGTWGPAKYTYIRDSAQDASGYYAWTTTESVSYGAPTTLWTTGTPSVGSQVFSSPSSGSQLSATVKSVSLDEYQSYTFNLVQSSIDNDASLNGFGLGCFSNSISPYHVSTRVSAHVVRYYQVLNNTLFRPTMGDSIVNCHDNRIGRDNHDNVIQGSFSIYNNVFGDNFYGNSLSGSCYLNVIGNNFHNNVSSAVISGNKIGDGCQDNTFAGEVVNNNIERDFYNNKINNGFRDNTIGPSTYSNTFSSFVGNQVGYGFHNNTLGSCYRNIFGNSFGSYNTVGDNFINNTIGNNCSNNTFGTYFTNNVLGNSIQYLRVTSSSAQTGAYVQYCTFDSGIKYVTLTSSDTSASSSNYIQNVHVHFGVSGASYSSFKTLTVPDRNLAYETNFIADGTNDIIV